MTWERWLSGPRIVWSQPDQTRGPEPMRLHRSPARSPVGEIPERPKGTDCKSVGSAFPGSNPGLATISDATTGCPPAHCDGRLLSEAARSRPTGFFVRPAPLPASLVSGSVAGLVTAARPSRTPVPRRTRHLTYIVGPIYKVERSTVWRTRCTRSGCSSMVERQPSKLHTRVRFPSPAPLTFPRGRASILDR